jgi:hypothetical protein
MMAMNDELDKNGSNVKGSGHDPFCCIITVFDC